MDLYVLNIYTKNRDCEIFLFGQAVDCLSIDDLLHHRRENFLLQSEETRKS